MWGLLGLLGLVLVLVAGALIYLTTPPGEARLRAFAVEQANQQLSGRVEIGGLDLKLLSLSLTGVKLYDPEGELVAEVAQVETRVAILPLLSKHVLLRGAHLEQPHLYLHQDARGLNLSRAIASRKPPEPEQPDTGPGTLRFTLEDFHLRDGAVAYVSEAADGTRQEVSLNGLEASATAAWASATEKLDAALDATASLARPLAGPVRLALKAQGEGDKLGAHVDFDAPGLGLLASGGMEGEQQLHAEIQKLTLAPQLGRALLPSYPVAAPVTLSGTVAQAGDLLKLQLDALAAGGTAEVKGSLNLEKLYTEGITARVRNMDVAALTGGGPSSSIAADLSVKGGGKSLETLEGTLDLTMPPSPISGETLGPVELHASASGGRFSLSRLQAQAPGVTLTAKGEGTLEDMELQGELVASNLSTFADTVGRLGSGEPLPLSGQGNLHFTAAGDVRHPAVTLDGGFGTLAWADTSLEGLWIELRLPDATRPLTADALLKVKKLTAGERAYENLKASLTTQGREIIASVNTTGAADLDFALLGTVDKDNEGLAIQDFSLKYPEAGWTLESPTHVSWGQGRVVVEPALTLNSGPQRLSLALKMEGERISADTQLKAFDLSRLPKAFLPSEFDMDGKVSGEVHVKGRMSRPDAQVDLVLEGGRYQEYSDLGFDVKARYMKDRATGTFDVSTPAGRIASRFDVPVQGMLRHRREPLSLELTVDRLDLGPALRMAQQPETVTGLLSGTLTVKGMANDPRLKLALQGSNVRYWGTLPQPPPVVIAPGALPDRLKGETLGFELTAQSDDTDGTLSAGLDLRGIASKATATLVTPFTLGGLMARPPTAQQVMDTPMRKLEAHVEDLPLVLLTQFGLAEQAGGSLSMTAELTGPLMSPVGDVKMQASRASVNGSLPLDGDVDLVTDRSSVKLQVAARNEERPLFKLEARVNASLAALQDQDVVGRIPFTLALKAGPISQNELMGLANAAPGAVNTLCKTVSEQVRTATSNEPQNVVSLDLKARGTLDDPQVDLNAGVQNIGLSQVGLGQASLQYIYKNARSTFTALLTSPKGGTLMAKGHIAQDLSLPTLRRGLNTDRLPLVMDVDAHEFDLSFLSGSQLPMVRTIEGVLAIDKVHVDGTLGAPTFRGKVEWTRGRLALDGLGDYRDVHLALDVTEKHLNLSDFSANSGGGSLKLSAEADRTPSGHYALKGSGNLDDFPLVFDDQLMALIQLRTQFEGDVSDQLVNIKQLALPELHIKLPDEKRKDLQTLDRPEGIVLVCQGEPMEKPKSKPATAESGGRPGSATGGSGSAPQRKYWVNITAPRNLWVNGSDVNTELGLSENFRVEYADTTAVYGEVKVLRGDVEVLGRRFNIQNSSQVRFAGPLTTPYINATAEYNNEKAGVKVFVAVRGQGKDFTIKPTSDPPLPETDIYTLLATGRRTLKAGSGASMNQGQVASVLGSVLASQARKALAVKLPLDVLTIEAGDEGLQGTRLEVGKYLTDDLYLGYSGRLGTPQNQSTTRRENANAVRLEYQFGPRWGVEVEYGDAQQGGADFIWSNEY